MFVAFFWFNNYLYRLDNDLEGLKGAVPKQRHEKSSEDAIQKISMLQLKLDEATKTIGIERE